MGTWRNGKELIRSATTSFYNAGIGSAATLTLSGANILNSSAVSENEDTLTPVHTTSSNRSSDLHQLLNR